MKRRVALCDIHMGRFDQRLWVRVPDLSRFLLVHFGRCAMDCDVSW